jgi:hypothetical protein
MATHDYVIDNQSASAFRSDLNGALQAIVTQNSNATAPATTYANMIWYDSANNQLKKRNEANSAWIVLGTIDEALSTFTPSGERALASQAQAEAGSDNTTVMTPLRSAQAIATLARTPTYQSTEQSFTFGNSITLTHGLGSLPSNVQVWLVCKVNDGGYLVNDWLGPIGSETFGDGANNGIVIAMNTTQVKLQIGSQSIAMPTWSTGTRFSITASSWRLVVRAWK